MRRCPHSAILFGLVIILTACAFPRSALYERPLPPERIVPAGPPASPPPWPVLPSLPADAKRLYLTTFPDTAEIYIDHRFAGLSPLTFVDYPFGSYFVEVRKQGYQPLQLWIDYTKNQVAYYWTLERTTGSLDLSVTPTDAVIRVGDRSLAHGKNLLPAGTYTVTVSAFGYETRRLTAVVTPDEHTALAVTLEKAAFSVSGLSLSRPVFNPHRTGPAATVALFFTVSAPGSGTVTVEDAEGRQVAALSLSRFAQAAQCVVWDGCAEDGQPVPDGVYRLLVTGTDEAGETPATASIDVKVDHRLTLEHQQLWSGAGGLTYAPSPDVPPAGTVDITASALAGLDFQPDWSAPISLGARLGVGDDHEAALSAGALLSDSYPAAFFVSGAWKYRFLSPPAGDGLSAALLGKITYQHEYQDDLFTHPTGLTLSLPARLSLGPFSLYAAIDLCLGLFKVSADRTINDAPGAWFWLYGRTGFSFSAGILSVSLSAAFRTVPLDEGLDLAFPIPTALSVTVYLPDSPAYLTWTGVMEWERTASRRWTGFGFGLLW